MSRYLRYLPSDLRRKRLFVPAPFSTTGAIRAVVRRLRPASSLPSASLDVGATAAANWSLNPRASASHRIGQNATSFSFSRKPYAVRWKLAANRRASLT